RTVTRTGRGPGRDHRPPRPLAAAGRGHGGLSPKYPRQQRPAESFRRVRARGCRDPFGNAAACRVEWQSVPVPHPNSASDAKRGDMGTGARRGLVCAGLASWAAGAVATFTNGEGSGAVALIGAGLLAGVLGLVGRWPSKISVSGSEISWPEVKETVDEQIEAAQDAGDE